MKDIVNVAVNIYIAGNGDVPGVVYLADNQHSRSAVQINRIQFCIGESKVVSIVGVTKADVHGQVFRLDCYSFICVTDVATG